MDMIGDFEFEPRMNDSDAVMWTIEKDPLLRSTILMVMLFESVPDRERLKANLDRASRVIPRLRQRVVGHPYSVAPPRWTVDPNFDLDYHLRFIRTAGGGTLRELFQLAEPIAMQGFDRARPLWEFTMVEGLDGGRAALIGKVHHSITDGVGGIKLQMELLDLEADPLPPLEVPPEPEPEDLGEARRFADAMVWQATRSIDTARGMAAGAKERAAQLLVDPVAVSTESLRTLRSLLKLISPALDPLSPLMTERSLSVHLDTMQVDLTAAKAASRVVSGKLNDAFLAGVAGGLRRYHLRHGYSPDALRMSMPINVRTERTAMVAGNQFAPARFSVPIDDDDPIRRMNTMRGLVDEWRHEPALGLTEPLAAVLNRLPATVTTALFGSMLKGIDFVTSNVPGAPVPVYVAGARMERQVAFGPMTGAAMNITLLSYQGDLNLGVTTDPAAIPDPDVLLECLQEGFDEVLALA
jgi:WS/DGAT/MGAT family acyltransferase